MRIKLFIKRKSNGEYATGLFELEQDHCLIGRRNSDLEICDAACSRQHALLYTGSDGRLRVKDLDSRNGTFVRGRNIADCSLRIGDEIRIGDCLIVVVGFQGGEPVAPEGGEVSRTSIRVAPADSRPRKREHYNGEGDSRSEESVTLVPAVPAQWSDPEMVGPPVEAAPIPSSADQTVTGMRRAP